jgi:hypothetical protein
VALVGLFWWAVVAGLNAWMNSQTANVPAPTMWRVEMCRHDVRMTLDVAAYSAQDAARRAHVRREELFDSEQQGNEWEILSVRAATGGQPWRPPSQQRTCWE